MQELRPSIRKQILWLFSEVVQRGEKWQIVDTVLPTLEISTDFDFSRSNVEQPIVELNIEQHGNGGWKTRLLLIKTIGNDIPQIFPQMYKDDDLGIMHVLSWVQSGTSEEPDLLHPKQPDYDQVCAIVNGRIADAWSRRKSHFPALKDEK